MKITIGETLDAKKVAFDLDTLIVSRLLITANSGAGKSYLLRVLMEQLFGRVQVITIDPESEFASLREKFPYVLVGKGGETPADTRSAAMVAERLLELRASAICGLYEVKPAERHLWVKNFFEAVMNAPKKLWHPTVFIVDEAHKFCPESKSGSSPAHDIVRDLVTDGRKRGFCAAFATQRLAKLDKDASAELLNRLVGGMIEDVDVDRAVYLLSVSPKDKAAFVHSLKTVSPGHFYAFGRAISKERLLFKVREAETRHHRSGAIEHDTAAPPTPEEVQKLLPKLADLPREAEEKARTVDELKKRIRELSGELAQAKKTLQPAKQTLQIDERALKSAARAAIEEAIKHRDEEWLRSVRDYQVGLNKRIVDFASSIAATVERYPFRQPGRVQKISVDVIRRPPTPTRVGTSEVSSRVIPSTQVGISGGTVPVAAREGARPESSLGETPADSNGAALSRSQVKILESLAIFESIGRSQVSKKWTAALSEVSHKSSGYTNNLGALRSRGLIDYPAPGMIALTEPGRAIVPAIDAPSSSEEILERCKSIVSASQWEIPQALASSYPAASEKKQLAEAIGVSPKSSGYTNNLGALRSAGMIDYPSQGTAKAAEWLFLE